MGAVCIRTVLPTQCSADVTSTTAVARLLTTLVLAFSSNSSSSSTCLVRENNFCVRLAKFVVSIVQVAVFKTTVGTLTACGS